MFALLPSVSSSVFPSLLSCLLLFQCGALYSLGLLNSTVEYNAPNSRPLPTVWSSSMSYLSLFGTGFMMIAGVLLARASPSSKTSIIRVFTFISALAFMALVLTPYAIQAGSALAIGLIVSLQGVPFAFLFVTGLELLAVWNPSGTGFAVGVGQMIFGLGSMVYATLYDRLSSIFTFSDSFIVIASVLSIPTFFLSFMICFPFTDSSKSGRPGATSPQAESICSLVRSQSFWLYVVCILGAQSGFAFIPFFQKFSTSFYINSSTSAITAFNLILLSTSLLRPVAGVLIDCLGVGQGAFSIGSKNFICLLLAIQMGLFGILTFHVEKGGYWVFVIIVGGISGVLACSACVAPVLARDLFGEEYAVAAFGIGGALALGLGEVSSTQMASFFLTGNNDRDNKGFEKFYLISIIWSGISLVAAVGMQKYSRTLKSMIKERDMEKGVLDGRWQKLDYETL